MAEYFDALDTGISVECPVCTVDIPLPHTDEPTTEGLSVTFDRTIADEHIEMHTHCLCRWVTNGAVTASGKKAMTRITNLSCPVHA